MRDDMQEVIIERPRRGSRYKYKDFRRRPEGELRGMRKPYGYDNKSQSDLIGPLKGFLRANVGRPWNKVWSEICDKTDSRSLIGSHLRQHIEWLVETNATIDEEGVIWSSNSQYRVKKLRDSFYVNPNSGLLCYVSRSREKYNKPKSNIVRFNGMEFYKHEDVWYEIQIQPIPDKRLQLKAIAENYDVHRRHHFDRDAFGYNLYSWIYPANDSTSCLYNYGEQVFAVSKKQIGKRMIRKVENFIKKGK